MEVAKKSYEGGTTSKTTIREDSKRASHGRKRKGREAASPTKPETGCVGNRKTKKADHPIDRSKRGKTCLLHGLGNST